LSSSLPGTGSGTVSNCTTTLEPLPLKKYVEYDIFQGSEEDEMGVVDKQ
jgi:hypothetical protein